MNKAKRLVKDFQALMKNIKSFSDGQATISNWDDENLEQFEITICPHDGLYKEGEFVFEIDASSYPEPPLVSCKTAIYHPNIDTISDPYGDVCLNLLEDSMWSDHVGLEDVVHGVLFLLYNPNLDDPAWRKMPYPKTMAEFERNVKLSIADERVEMYQFPVNSRYAGLHPAETQPNMTYSGPEEGEEDGDSEKNGDIQQCMGTERKREWDVKLIN